MLSRLMEWLENIGRMTLGTVGVLIASISAFFITYAAVELTAPGFQIGAVLYGLLTAAMIFALAGGALFWRAMKGASQYREQRRQENRQQTILEKAEQLGGRVTVAEMALNLSYTVDEVREQLEAFVDEGIAEPGVSDAGREVYLFPEFLDEDDKMTARDPMSKEFEAIMDEHDSQQDARDEVALGEMDGEASSTSERADEVEASAVRQRVEQEQ